jgi:uncharacterized protein YdgA (DUF945 family)
LQEGGSVFCQTIKGGIVKKSVIAVVAILVLVVGWAGATYVIGGRVEDRYLSFLDQLQGRGPFELTNENYQRGFLTSRARTVLQFKVPVEDEAKQPFRLVFEHTFHHGPLPAGKTPDGKRSLTPMLALIETRLVEFSPSDRSLEQVLEEVPQLKDSQAYTIVGLSGGGHSRWVIPAFEKKMEDEGVTINWGGLICDSKFSRELVRMSGNFSISGLEIQGDKGNLVWNGVNFDFDLNEAFPLVYVGNSEGHFGSLEASFPDSEGGNKAIAMKNIEMSSQSSRDDDIINGAMTMNMAGLIVDGKTFGPGMVKMAARGLDGQALSHFQRNMLEVNQEENLDPEAMLPMIMQNYSQLFRELGAGSPEIEISQLRFTTPMGGFDGTARLKYHGEDGQMPADILSVLQNIDAEAHIVADENLVRTVLVANMEKEMKNAREQGVFPAVSDEEISRMANREADGRIEAITQQQFAVRKDGKLTTHAVFNRGDLQVNGRQLMSRE